MWFLFSVTMVIFWWFLCEQVPIFFREYSETEFHIYLCKCPGGEMHFYQGRGATITGTNKQLASRVAVGGDGQFTAFISIASMYNCRKPWIWRNCQLLSGIFVDFIILSRL